MAKDIFESAKVLRERANDSLVSEHVGLKEKLWKATFDLRRGQLSNTAQILKIRRQIARVRTIQTERALGLSAAPADDSAPKKKKAAKKPAAAKTAAKTKKKASAKTAAAE